MEYTDYFIRILFGLLTFGYHGYLSEGLPKESSLATSWNPSSLSRRGMRSVSSSPNIEIMVIVDQSMVDYHGEGDVTTYSLTLMNMVSKIYKIPSLGFPVNIVVVKVLISSQVLSDSFVVTHDARTTLQSFCAWQRRQNPMGDEDPFHYDHAILLTRVDICAVGDYPCSTIGTAMFGGMCNVGFSCSVVQDTGLNAAITIVQMLGNSFGINFDEKTSCRRDLSSYIMSKKTDSKNNVKLQWSSCSRESLKNFLRKPSSRCLTDKPQAQDVERGDQNVKLPGEIYNLDAQCRLTFGAGASFCRIMYGFACHMLWCHRGKGSSGCTTTRWGAVDGTECGKDMWCIKGSCVASAKSEPVDGSWGGWSDWSQCSRTCGGGIQKSSRECNYPSPSHGGKYCKGERRRLRICNEEDCPPNSAYYRDQQCAEFDTSWFGGKQFHWRSFFAPSQECSLVCKADGVHYYRTMLPRVRDGTPCRPGSYDRCTDGLCLAVGCDYEIGSKAQEDECGVCQGNGTTCTIIERIYKNPRGIGYKSFLTIPSGSTNIAIREENASRNYIALFGNQGKNILNGNYRIDRPGTYIRENTVLQYIRRGHREGLWIKGPLQDSLQVAILFQTNNTGVWYRYAKPKMLVNNQVRSAGSRTGIFLWRQSYDASGLRWSKCSKTCGRGHRFAIFDCVDAVQDKTINPIFCSLKEKPELVQQCQIKECKIPNSPLEWKRDAWGSCSRSCGTGYQRRTVSCVRKDTGELVNYRLCNQKRPRTVQTCNLHACPKGEWKSYPWSKCSAQCGNGTRERKVACEDSHGTGVDSSLCEEHRQPHQQESCQGTCTRWVTGEWSQCSSCQQKQYRCAICIHMKTFQPSIMCDQNDQPAMERACEKSYCNPSSP